MPDEPTFGSTARSSTQKPRSTPPDEAPVNAVSTVLDFGGLLDVAAAANAMASFGEALLEELGLDPLLDPDDLTPAGAELVELTRALSERLTEGTDDADR